MPGNGGFHTGFFVWGGGERTKINQIHVMYIYMYVNGIPVFVIMYMQVE